MLTKWFFEFCIFVIGQLLSLFSFYFPEWDHLTTLTSAITSLFGVTTQVVNFFYFMFGDFLPTAVVMVEFLIPYKFIICPILGFIRKLFVWGG